MNTDKVVTYPTYNFKYSHTKYENIIPFNKVRTKNLNKFKVTFVSTQ